jgi:molecular chaperone DnaJ
MDLYRILGVNQSASADEIERAFTRLARRYHPGINPGDRASAQAYEEIQRAYAVLGDPARRGDYDRHGATPGPAMVEASVEFQGFDFSAPVEGPGAATFAELFADVFQDAARRATAPVSAGELHVSLQLSFVEALGGGAFPLSLLRRDRCPGCAGVGYTPRPAVACPQCAGDGTRRWARGHMLFAKVCEACEGSGQLTRQVCRLCAGAGVAPRSEVVTVVVPPGIEDAARVVVPGRGHVDGIGAPAGDLYVTIDVAPHPFFKREGRDLCLTLPVGVHEAALGARVDVPTPDGPIKLRIPPGTSSGQRLRLRAHGVPSAHGGDPGDLLIDIQIVLPPVKDERSKELLREFGRLNDVDVRQHLFPRKGS